MEFPHSKISGSGEAMDDGKPAATPSQQKAAFEASNLKPAFEWQHQQFQKMLREEFEKRLPPLPSMDKTPSLSKQVTSVWRSFLPPDHGSKLMEEHTVDTLLFKNNKLQQETESLRDALGKLQLDNSSLSKECSSWKGRYEKVRSEFAQERVKSAEQELKMASLRSMLIPKTEVQLSDNEVVARFASLRSQILKLIKTVWSPVNFVPKADVSAEQYNFKILYTFVEGKVDMRYMDNLLRGVVFSILNEHVFSVRHYPIDTKNESLGEALSYAESYMFDKLPKDSHASVIDWRMASMKATAAFKDDATILARTAFNTVVSFFQIFETTDAKATQGKKLLKNICKDAVALSMMMRNAKDEYCVDMLGHAMNKPASEWGELVEEEDSHPAANTEQPDTIAYFMTGALVKLPYGNAENIKVLEKAQAVVFSRPGNKKV